MFPPDDDEPYWGWRVMLVMLRVWAGALCLCILIEYLIHKQLGD